MNNKLIGNEFEKEVCQILASHGWWVHFINPDRKGAQPFDIIAVKDEEAGAIDCKTSARPIFPYTRLEDNQVNAFEKWLACGNDNAVLIIKYNGHIYCIDYQVLKKYGKVDLRLEQPWEYDYENNT